MLGKTSTRHGYRVSRPAGHWRFRRNYSVLHEPVFEHIDVPCGVSSPITIKLHNPSPSTPLPLLLYITTYPPSPALTPVPLLSPTHTTIHIPIPHPLPFPQPLHKLLYAYTHILSLLRPPQKRSYAQPAHHYPPIAIYGSSTTGIGGSLATALALTEAHPKQGVGRYPSALITTDSIFDYSPLTIASLHPSSDSTSSLSGPGLGIRTLFSTPPSTLDPLASPLLLFRGAGFHSSAFPGSWVPSPDPTGARGFESDSDLDLADSPIPSNLATPSPESQPDSDSETPIDFDPTRPQKRSYLKFPPAHSGLRLPLCNFQLSHPITSPPPSKSKSKPTTPPPPAEPLEVSHAHLMASALNRAVRMGYDTPLSRRSDEGEEEERAVITSLPGSGEVEERGAVGAREWLRETMGWL